MLDFITIGGATRDVFLEFSDLDKVRNNKNSVAENFLMVPYGEKLVADESFYSYGGGAVNSAISFARLGLRVAALCNVGFEGTGSLVVKKLKDEGVKTALVNRDKKHHTGLSILILGKDNEHTAFLERGANDYLKITKTSILKKAKWIYLSSLTGESAENLPLIFKIAKKYGIRIAFNPGSEQLSLGREKLQPFIESSEILLLNLEEAEGLVNKGRKKLRKAQIIKEASSLGATITVVTEGEAGSHAVFEGNIYSQKSMPKRVVDTTGAGDAFGSTFSFGIFRGFDIRYSLKIAAINAAAVVSKKGAHDGLLSYNEIKRSKWL